MKTSVENKNETKWAPIFKDMAILMCVMGGIALICKLIMMPFEITTPTDTLVSLIRKGGVTGVVENNKPSEVRDAPFIKELRKVTGQAKPEDEDAGFFDSLWEKIGFAKNADQPAKNEINSQDNTGRTPLMWAVYANYNNPPMADVTDELFSQASDELNAYKEALKEMFALAEREQRPTEEQLSKAEIAVNEAEAKLMATQEEIKKTRERGVSDMWNKKDVLRLYYLRALLNSPGIDVHIKDQDGFTALHWAAWSGMPFCSFMLVQAGLDINARENNGYTPLMLAAMRGNVDTVEMLLRLGADKDVTNNKGATATSLATSAATSYHKSDTVAYTLIYSKQRNKFYANTVKALNSGVTPMEPADIEKQMNAAWARFERQLLDKAQKENAGKSQPQNDQIESEELNVEHAAGEPAFSGNPDQENP